MNINIIALVLMMLGVYCFGLATMYIYFVRKYGSILAFVDSANVTSLYKQI